MKTPRKPKARNPKDFGSIRLAPEVMARLGNVTLTERAGEFPTRWEPKTPGQCLDGILQGVKTLPKKGKMKARDIFLFNTADGNYSVSESADLRGKLTKADTGKPFVIQYLGLKKLGKKQPMKVFKVFAVVPKKG